MGLLARASTNSKRTLVGSVLAFHDQERLALLSTAFLFPLAGATLMLPWLLALRISRMVRGRRLYWVRSPYDVPLALFLLMALVAGVLSSLRLVALESWVLAAVGFVVMLQATLGSLREAPAFARTLHKAFALGTLTAAVYGLALFLTQHLDQAHLLRAHLLTLGAEALGFALMAGIFLSLPLLQEPLPWPVISLLTLTASSAGVIATFNRAALYGLVAGGLTYLSVGRRKLPVRFLGAAFLSLGLGITVVASTPVLQRALAHALEFTGYVRGPVEGSLVLRKTFQFLFSVEGNSTDRLAIWQIDLRVIRHYPWFGLGLGGFRAIGHEWSAGISGAETLPRGTPPHNLYFNLAAEVGIPGALAFLALPVIAILRALKHKDAYHIAQIACMAGMLTAEIRDGILMGYHMSLGFILILGMMGAQGGSSGGGPGVVPPSLK